MALSRPVASGVRVCRVCGTPLEIGQVRCDECGKDHSLVTPIAIGSDLGDWRAAYVRVRDSMQPPREVLALAGILRRAKASRVTWKPRAVILRFKSIFGYEPRGDQIRMAKELNAQADEQHRKASGA